jgi:hypothetical protein
MHRDRPIVDFDHHAATFRENGGEQMRALREKCPVAFSPRHGGFWVVSRRGDLDRKSVV